MQIENKDRIDFNIQISHLQNVSNFPYEQEYPFLVKVLGEDSVSLNVKMADNEEIETVFEPGWNVEIVKGIISVPDGVQIQIGY